MCSKNERARISIQRQADMFRLAERDCGLTLAFLERETGIPKRTLQDWKNGTTMPAWALFALGHRSDGGALIPDELLSLVADPYGKHVGTDQSDDGALHDAAEAAGSFSAEFLSATSPHSEGGVAITPRERDRLGEHALTVAAKMRAAAPLRLATAR